MKLVIGSRGSQLALVQAHEVRNRLLALHDGLDVEISTIRTTGDATTGSLRSLGGTGVFTKALEDALLAEDIDLAVHSLKDLPTQMHPDLALVATPEREDVRDALVGPAYPRWPTCRTARGWARAACAAAPNSRPCGPT